MWAKNRSLVVASCVLAVLLASAAPALAEPSGLTLDVSGVPTRVRYDREKGKDAHPEGRVLVANADGSEIPVEEWSGMELSFVSPDGLLWETERTSQIGVFQVRLVEAGPAPDSEDWVSIHLLPHVTGGVERLTTFTATSTYVPRQEEDEEGADEYYDDEEEEEAPAEVVLTGRQEALTRVVGSFFWWVWALVAIAIGLVVRVLTRPRLPELAPAIDLCDGHGPRRIRGEFVRDGSPVSLLPERGHFMVSATGTKDAALQNLLGFARVGLVARRGEGGQRAFELDRATVRRLVRLNSGSTKLRCNAIDAKGRPVEMTDAFVMQLVRGNDAKQRKVRILLNVNAKHARRRGHA